VLNPPLSFLRSHELGLQQVRSSLGFARRCYLQLQLLLTQQLLGVMCSCLDSDRPEAPKQQQPDTIGCVCLACGWTRGYGKCLIGALFVEVQR
jgi:hypothetical protein